LLGLKYADNQQNYIDACNYVKEQLINSTESLLLKLRDFTKNELIYLFIKDIKNLNEVAHPDLKNKKEFIIEAIDTQKLDIKPMLTKFYNLLERNDEI
jgi:hypothetical protein